MNKTFWKMYLTDWDRHVYMLKWGGFWIALLSVIAYWIHGPRAITSTIIPVIVGFLVSDPFCYYRLVYKKR